MIINPVKIKQTAGKFFKYFLPAATFTILLANMAVLFSWIFNVSLFKGYMWGLVPIKANTAVCFILAGVSLLIQSSRKSSRGLFRLRSIINIIIILIPLITLLEYFFSVSLGIDQLIAKESYQMVYNPFPGRMAPNTAIAFIFLGISMLLTHTGDIPKILLLINGIMASFAVGLGVATIYSYFAGIVSIAQNFNVPLMAVSTSVFFILLGIAQLVFISAKSTWHLELESNVLVLFTGGIIVLVTISLITYRTVLLMMNNEGELVKNYRIRDGLEEVLSIMNEAETGQRGFIITGNEAYLNPFIAADSRIQDKLETLDELLFDRGKQIRRLSSLKSLCGKKFEELHRTIEIRRRSGFEAAQSAVLTNHGKMLMDSIRVVCQNMETSEMMLLKNIQYQSDKNAHITVYSLPIGAFFSISFLAAALYIINIEYRKRKSAEAELLKANLELEERVRQRTAELMRSNAELEQFAYVASHDLQEPLRMVSSYTQLIARRYKDKLDQDAIEFINFAVDGALRMQKLIRDLLSFSRLATDSREYEWVDLNDALTEAESNLKAVISETGTEIKKIEMPRIFGNKTQLTRLFQNLLENSIKYRNESSPRISITVREEQSEWEFSVTDNGIGISDEYFGKIFQIFQRLHSKEKYAGTGIGLAI
ncbi:MAG: sensor histidine kinase, partial [Syntrophothermus sp.]